MIGTVTLCCATLLSQFPPSIANPLPVDKPEGSSLPTFAVSWRQPKPAPTISTSKLVDEQKSYVQFCLLLLHSDPNSCEERIYRVDFILERCNRS
ncbi:hypothetical protein B9Z19DRAFT_1090286 [Tuber borchii]|uniref:Uncharacterized protein n=1 Tax=Tuber borchii TaxID=42251 RepID=A0A2T6ZJ07_TUBBO|nr:hypothetical protein B9Z19DRAFT_1090286 [Tuber borchii]